MAITNLNPIASHGSSGSLILALAARYEQAWDEYNHIDRKQPRKPTGDAVNGPDWHPYYRSQRGMADNFEETQLLRETICYQVPDTDEELTVLAHHAWIMFDDQSKMTKREIRALQQALNSIFDYLASNGRMDSVKAGDQFTTNAMLAFHRRRYRTGVTAED